MVFFRSNNDKNIRINYVVETCFPVFGRTFINIQLISQYLRKEDLVKISSLLSLKLAINFFFTINKRVIQNGISADTNVHTVRKILSPIVWLNLHNVNVYLLYNVPSYLPISSLLFSSLAD